MTNRRVHDPPHSEAAGRRPGRTLVLLLATSFALLTPALQPVGPTPARASSRPLAVPIPPGETWFVCQGYSGSLTHAGVTALDLSRAPDSPGPRGCMKSSKYLSAGSEVVSPAAGVAHRVSGCCGDDFVCVDLDSGGSIAIGHLDHRIRDGTRVRTVDRLGTVAWPSPANGDYAHLHLQAHPAPGCMEGSEAVPFDSEHGFRFACNPDLSFSGEINEHSGIALSRCGERRERLPSVRKASSAKASATVVRALVDRESKWFRWARRRWTAPS
jgi:hypothetical protein